MTNTEKIVDIITKNKSLLYPQKKAEKDLISLLKQIDDNDKKQLKPKILKLMREYRKDMFRLEDANDKYQLAAIAGFVMLNYSEFKSHWGINFDLILEYYCPDWFSDYYNNDEWMILGYERMLEYVEKSYIQPSGNKIAKELVGLSNSTKNFQDITLQEHIWTLFQYESEVHLTKRYEKYNMIEWGAKLIELANENKIDRKKLLQECLLSTTRNLNKLAIGFFWDIFESLNPTEDELLQLQEVLLITLQSQHSKPINQTLKYFKRIYKNPKFDIDGFIEQIPLLLSWNVKAVVNATLTLMDLLIKAYPAYKEQLALLMVQTLISEDESLQTKVLKLLKKYKLLEDKTILDEIAIYADRLYHSTKQLLPQMQSSIQEEEMVQTTTIQRISEDNRIIYPESFDDMVFFFSQVFEGNRVHDFDIFLSLLPSLKSKIDQDNIARLDPALQRAAKYFKQTLKSEQSNSSILLNVAIAFIRYLIPIYEQYPALKNKAKIYNEELTKAEIGFYGSYLDKFEDKNLSSKSTEISKHLLHRMLESSFTPLSTPTHEPCWISLDIFVKRLSNIKIEQIDTFDFELALSRTVAQSIDVDLSSLDEELRSLLEYAFDNKPFDMQSIKHPHLWLGALLRTKEADAYRKYLAHFDIIDINDNPFELEWKAYWKPWEYETWEGGKKVKKLTKYSKLTLMRHQYINNLPFDSIYKHTSASIYNGVLAKYDDRHYFCISPLSVHPFAESLLLVLSKYYESADAKRCATNAIMVFSDIWAEEHNTNYLLLAYLMVYFDKTVRTLASELWYKATLQSNINHKLLGKTLGLLEYNEYAPLKRFTDLIVTNMLGISSLHNQGLYELMSAMMAHMNDTPIKGTKKLLELYSEVLILSNNKVPQEVKAKLETWSEVKSLKGIVKRTIG
jgi:hypothetical protein